MTEFIKPHLGKSDAIDPYMLPKHESLRTISIGFRRKNVFRDYVKFAIVRHPFDRIASLHQGYSPECTFSDLVRQMASGQIDINKIAFFWPMGRWLCDRDGNNLVDVTFRLEDGFGFVTDFLKDLGVPNNGNFPHLNEGKLKSENREKYEEVWNGLSLEIRYLFKELYAWDYEAFGYEL